MSCPNCAPSAASSTVLLDSKDGRPSTIVLVGNPNVGKSTLFNHVTGARQRVVNAPGTTVHVMSGVWKSLKARVLDLPGTYSLVPTSPDEEVVTETLAGAVGSLTAPNAGMGIDLILALLDGGSMTRSLYLLAQLAQTGQPVAAVVTMTDVAEQNGEPVDVTALARTTGIPVMGFDPRSGKDYAVLDGMVASALASRPRIRGIDPDPTAPGFCAEAAAVARTAAVAIDERDLLAQSACACGGSDGRPPQADEQACSSGTSSSDETTSDSCPCCAKSAAESVSEVVPVAGASSSAPESSEAEMDRAMLLFGWVDTVEQEVRKRNEDPSRLSRSDKIDRLLLNPFIGTGTFFVLLWLLFQMAGSWVGPIQDWFDGIFASTDDGAFSLANGVSWLLGSVGLGGGWLESMLVGGLVTGMGVVASFFPLMFVIYAALSVLEDSGYMARVAFLGDRLMRRIGLDGRVILPLIIGFGCNVPSLAAARTLPSARQRLVTVLITPYTSCAARLTIYLMIGKIFFGGHAGTVVFVMYLLSLFMIVAGAWILKHFITKDEQAAPLMLVLPAYQVPRLAVMLKTTWTRAWSFVTGAGKIIVLMTVVVWFMSAVPIGASAAGKSFADPELAMEDSLYGETAKVLEPVFAPAGFGEWHLTGALMTGFVAKETVVSSIVTSYNLDPEVDAGNAEENGDDMGKLPTLLHQSLEDSAGHGYEALAAFAFLVFVLTYTPCMATVAEQAKLIGGRKTTLAVIVQLAVAWGLAVAVFQIGKLFL
ncbi:ferrous iron transport protein B [Actinomycetaceae bacterium L2_0104]